MSSSPGGYRVLLPSKRPHPDSPATKESEPRPEVVLISLNMAPGPIGHAIYALPLHPHKTAKYDDSGPILRQQQQNSEVYPILEIPSSYMRGPFVRCLKLKSRLYYVGGMCFDNDDCVADYLSRVYYIELDDLYAYAAASKDGVTPPAAAAASALLKEGVPMSCGKRSCYAFVAQDKLYAIGLDNCPTQFEVFDPDTSQWSLLPQPPFADHIISHALIGNRLIFSPLLPDMYWRSAYFDIANGEWVMFHPQKPFESHIPALFVGGSLYALPGHCLSLYGPCTRRDGVTLEDEGEEENFSKLFDDMSIASNELLKVIDVPQSYSSRLLHLGNNTFLYIMGFLPWLSKDGPLTLRLVWFEVTGETINLPSEEKDINGGTLVFQAKLLHSLDYVCRSKSGAVFLSSFINGCFFGSAIA